MSNQLDLQHTTHPLIKPTTLNFLDDIIDNDLIHSLLFSFCSPATLIRTSRTCRIAYAAVLSYFRLAFNYNCFLSLFFADPSSFRSLQARTASLISGHSTFCFLDRRPLRQKTLELYVHPKARFEVGEWLVANGYEYSSAPHQAREFVQAASSSALLQYSKFSPEIPYIAARFRFSKPLGETVQVIVASRTPMDAILNLFPTHLMSVLTHNIGYALYPQVTFEQRRTVATFPGPHVKTEAEDDMALADGKEMSDDFFSPRWICDAQTWTISLDDHSNPGPGTTLSPVSVTSWHLSSSTRGDLTEDPAQPVGPHLHSPTVIESQFLAYTYLLIDDDIWRIVRSILAAAIERERARSRVASSSEAPRYFDHEFTQAVYRFREVQKQASSSLSLGN